MIQGLAEQGLDQICNGVLSGYIGDTSIGKVIINTVKNFRKKTDLVYLCDPVMGNIGGKKCFVKEDIPHFFKEFFPVADIITPNHSEVEVLYGEKINNIEQLKQATSFFYQKGVKTIIVRNLKWNGINEQERYDFLSDQKAYSAWLAITPSLPLHSPINGSGDLFSALYLGINLLGHSPLKSFQYALNKTQEIVMETMLAKQRELKILGHNYCESPNERAKLKPILL